MSGCVPGLEGSSSQNKVGQFKMALWVGMQYRLGEALLQALIDLL